MKARGDAVADLLLNTIDATRAGLLACEAGDANALHRALDSRDALIRACANRAGEIDHRDSGTRRTIVELRRLDAELQDAAARLRDVFADDLAAADRTQTALSDYLASPPPAAHRLDRAV